MDALSDDLTKPVPPRAAPRSAGRGGSRWLLGGVGLVVVVLAAYAVVFGDRRGGVPFAEAPITSAKPAPSTVAPEIEPPVRPAGGRRDAERLEAESGVAVIRPPGAAAPPAVMIEVPSPSRGSLAVAPDPRLVESSRHGPLPRIGPDGARPLDVYRREPATTERRPAARVAVVVGGLGLSRTGTADAIGKLPPAVSLAFAPYGSDLARSAGEARSAGHELFLQVPMEPFDYPDSDPGPRTLLAGAKPAENLDNLHWVMSRFTGYVGLLNYMGGKLTADERALAPILKDVGARGLGFLDDGSSSRSRLTAVAGDLPTARAVMVLDAAPRADLIDKALERLEAEAASGRVAVATASALPVSIERISRWAAGLEARGIQLVPASAALAARSREAARP